ncbi:MAG: AAA family ATPase [Firmicutes bacterium]|nr:AAA family ATPase [Bacillota bacterium]
MKMISCHIENFGTLSNYDRTFDKALTCVCLENGSGKSTLAAFIRAMLYGLPQDKTNSTFNDRRHYAPFNSQKFGGSITLEKDGKTYRIERDFDRKSPSRDSVKLFCGADEIPVPAEGTGKFLLGFNEDSFLRSVYLDCADTELGATSDIRARLAGFVGMSDDGTDITAALELIDKPRKQIKGEKKTKSSLIALCEAERNEVLGEISEAGVQSAGLAECYGQINELDAKIKQDDALLTHINEQRVILGNKKTYEGHLKEYENRKAARDEIVRKYPKGLPSLDELTHLNEHITAYIRLSGELKNTRLSDEDTAKLAELEKMFAKGLPTDGEKAEISKKLREAGGLDAKISGLEAQKPTEHQLDLIQRFSAEPPDDAFTEKAEGLVKRCNTLRTEIDALLTAADAQPRRGVNIPVFAAAVILLAAGVLLALKVNILAGTVLIAAGVILFAFAAPHRRDSGRANETAMRSAQCRQCEEELREMLVKYRYYTANGAVSDYAEFKNDLSEYGDYVKTKADNDRELRGCYAALDAVQRDISEFFAKYGMDADAHDALARLMSLSDSFTRLKSDRERLENEASNINRQISGHKKFISDIGEKYGIADPAADINTLESARQSLDTAEAEVEKAKKRAEDFKAQNRIDTDIDENTAENAEQLKSDLEEKRLTLVKLKNAANGKNAALERKAELEDRLKALDERLKALESRRRILTAARDMLSAAEQAINDKYVKPVRDSYLVYAKMLSDVPGERVSMDKDYRLFFERNGENRDAAHLSTGQRSLCSLCLKLALTDNMFPNDRPFLVLDDPFAGLDAANMQKAAKLVKKLANDRQIIYFCAHESRKV